MIGMIRLELIEIKQGKKEGKAEMASAIARNLIAMRMSKEAVAKATGLSIDEVQALMAS